MQTSRRFLLVAAVCCVFAADVRAQSADEEQAIAAIRAAGGQVIQLAQNDPRLDVAFHLSQAELTPEMLQKLVALKGRLTSLNLRGTNMNDSLAKYLSPLSELTRLHLEKTAVTDAALVHLKPLQKLEYLNLYGTNITDAGLPTIAELPALRKVYLWETKITPDGERQLAATRTDVVIVGVIPPPMPPADPVEAPRPGVAKAAENAGTDAKKADPKKPQAKKPAGKKAEEKKAEEKKPEEKPAGAKAEPNKAEPQK